MRKLKIKCRFKGVVRDKDGNIIAVVEKESDLLLRNWLCGIKSPLLATALVAGDGCYDVLNNNKTGGLTVAAPRMMLGSGVTAADRTDYRIQTPLYTPPDTMTIGTVTLATGNQVTLALVGVHTFAAETTVTEAGFLSPSGSTVTYLTTGNIQFTRDVFSVLVPAGGTFTGTWTLTIN